MYVAVNRRWMNLESMISHLRNGLDRLALVEPYTAKVPSLEDIVLYTPYLYCIAQLALQLLEVLIHHKSFQQE